MLPRGLFDWSREGRVSTPKLAYAQDAPLFAAGRSACTAGLTTWSLSAPVAKRKVRP